MRLADTATMVKPAKRQVLSDMQNGNYRVMLLSDGTKIRYGDVDEFIPVYPESIDLMITKRCDLGCPQCHEMATADGKHADLRDLVFIDTLLPGTEIAIGGGNPLIHPDLIPFLVHLKLNKLVANITVNQKHFMRPEMRAILIACSQKGYLHGIGVSLSHTTPELIEALKELPNTVVHVIEGWTDPAEIRALYGHGLKLLILGYKDFGRGHQVYDEKIKTQQRFWNDAFLEELLTTENAFAAVSFDNLALKHMDVRRFLPEEEWQRFYMGDDGSFTMYIDAVNGQYAKSSVSTERYPITEDITEMFSRIRNTLVHSPEDRC